MLIEVVPCSSHARSGAHATKSCETTRELLVEASTHLPSVEESPDVVLVTDAGSENFGDVNALLGDSSWLERVVAQAEIIFSNRQIEAWWRELKHRWLFLHLFDTVAAGNPLLSTARAGSVASRSSQLHETVLFHARWSS